MSCPVVYHPRYSAELPSTHRFPMAKFKLLHNFLLEQGLIEPKQIHLPISIARRDLERLHPQNYHEAFSRDQLTRPERRRIGLPTTSGLIQRTWLAVGGTLLTARLALQHGLACHLAGGTHHAHPEFGSGFCIFNDCAVTARVLLHNKEVERILIVDLDVHQGDGSAACFQDEERVTTFSVHATNNFPLQKVGSDIDIPLPDRTDDALYLAAIGDRLPEVLDERCPQLVLFNAGVDPHRDDRLGRLNLSNHGLLMRDRLVLDACLRRQIPVATVIGGGYDTLGPLVKRHAIIFRVAREQARLFGLGITP
ncbi:histone deacetylase [Synechococcus sp. M16CYN]|uniref:histone deacetylase family protein n=1 Tax=Synechococcus sp. M16CYN TaxID=3103139 RepID=UPI00324F5844